MKEIVVNSNEIARIIAEKYGVDYKKGEDVILTVESKTVNYNTINTKKVYYPVAYIWKEEQLRPQDYNSDGDIIPSEMQGEREFIEILVQYVPDDICTYPEYKGKPYYSIHYKQNGEEFVGFGTYKIEVLSGYLKECFMKGSEENDNKV